MQKRDTSLVKILYTVIFAEYTDSATNRWMRKADQAVFRNELNSITFKNKHMNSCGQKQNIARVITDMKVCMKYLLVYPNFSISSIVESHKNKVVLSKYSTNFHFKKDENNK